MVKSYSSAPLKSASILAIVYLLFFLSGFSAISYQLVWQRMLYIVFGLDLESLTIIVSVFMFGLGLGGLCGGMLADKFLHYLLSVYIVFEIIIGCFGSISPYMIQNFESYSFYNNYFVTATVGFLILSVPTFFMGATFPILVRHVLKYQKTIGESISFLYFSNTLGAATGAFFSAFIFLYWFELNTIIYVAVMINFIIAATAGFTLKEIIK